MFDLASYETVKDRITRFYADHPDGRITTELVGDPANLSTSAAFKASVWLGDVLKATGYAYESQGQGVNRDAWVENAETSAIGRALANMDYCGSLRPSREEMSKVSHGSMEWETKLSSATTRDELVKIFGDAWGACPEGRKSLQAIYEAKKKELK